MHSPVGPSSLHRLIQCPASLRLSEGLPPEPPKQAAEDGTAAHWAMAELMAERPVAPGAVAPNGVTVDADMIEAADLIVEDVRKTLAPFGLPLSACATEVPMDISAVHPLCFGTPDIRVWLPNMTLVVWDFKYGFRFVDEFENPQLAAYARGGLDQAGVSDLQARVDLRIVQPRAYSRRGAVRSWSGPAHMIRGTVNQASMAAHAALSEPPAPPPQARVGPECADCRARLRCEAFAMASGTAMQFAGTHIPQDMTNSEIGIELRYAKSMLSVLESRVEALEEAAQHKISSGQRVPGWGIVHNGGRLKWNQADTDVIALGAALRLDLAKPREAITPKQALKAGLPESIVQMYATRTGGAQKLVQESDSDMRRIFGG